MTLPKIATHEEWLAARLALLEDEKAMTRGRDAISTKRRELPMVRIETDYEFDGADGPASLLDLFDGRSQLILYHFMFDPSWDAGCSSCTAGTDEISPGFIRHLHARDTSFAMVSLAPYPKLAAYAAERGWDIPWYSSFGTTFNDDFAVHHPTTRAARTTSANAESSPRRASRARRPGRAASCRSTARSSTPTRTTPAGWSAPAARTTSSTSPPSVARRTGRSRRAGPSPPTAPGPTSPTDGSAARAGC